MDIKKELRDQTAHVVAAIIIIMPLVVWLSVLTTMWVGLGIGIVRELTEEGSKISLQSIKNVLSSKRSLMDILFWGIGGFIVGFLFIQQT